MYFILSEEDKTNSISLDYWFKCIDLDCDGSLRANEMLVGGLAHLCHTLRAGMPSQCRDTETVHTVLLQVTLLQWPLVATGSVDAELHEADV